jgi:tripartite-type tricarboxylate transporter receptor subunit TctC
MHRRQILRLLGISALGNMPRMACAQTTSHYPVKSIQVIVPFPAGGPTDLMSRMACKIASDYLQQPIVIFNQPGGGGTLGIANSVLNAKPDGYTLGIFTGGMLRIPVLQRSLWHPIDDFTYISGLVQSTGDDAGLVVTTDSPYKNFSDFLNAARRNPGKISYGSPGFGSGGHIVMEQLAEAAKIDLTHVPYKGSTELIPALLGNHVSAIFDLASGWEKLLHEGRVRLLLTFGENRASSRWPNVPNAHHFGFNVNGVYKQGIVGPAGMDKKVIDTLHEAFVQATLDSQFKALVQQQNQQSWTASGHVFKTWASEQYDRERNLLKRLMPELN